jgi:hypothetical protein
MHVLMKISAERNMKYLKFAALFVAATLNAETSRDISSFMLDWTIVCNMATADYQSADNYQKLATIDRNGASFVAEFWRSKALSATIERRKEIVEIYSRKQSDTDVEKNQIKHDLLNEISLLLQGYYYDHAPEISAMILLRVNEFTEGRSPTIQAQKSAEKKSSEEDSDHFPPEKADTNNQRMLELQRLRDEYRANLQHQKSNKSKVQDVSEPALPKK